MGCKSSKTLPQLQIITYEFPKVKNSDIDIFFNQASQLLWKAEVIRKRFVISSDKCYEHSGANQLIRNKYIETIKVLIWSISSGCQGQISRSGLKIVDTTPFISITPNELCVETKALYQSVKEYLDTVIEGSDLVKLIIDGLTNMKVELLKISEEWIDPRDTSESATTFRDNTTQFHQELAKVKAFHKVLIAERTMIETNLPQVKKIVLRADEVGALAYHQRLIKPLDIFERFITLERRKVLESSTKPEVIEPVPVEANTVNNNETDLKPEPGIQAENKDLITDSAPNNNIMVQDQSLNANQTPYNLHTADTIQKDVKTVSFLQPTDGLEDSFRHFGPNKIQVNAPEMKDFSLQEPTYVINENQYPYYKFSAPAKEIPHSQPTLFKSPWESNLKTIPNMPVYKTFDQGGNGFDKENYSDIDAILEDINKKYGPFDFKVVSKSPKKMGGEENIEDDDILTNLPEDNSLNIRHFKERRQYYMITMKD